MIIEVYNIVNVKLYTFQNLKQGWTNFLFFNILQV